MHAHGASEKSCFLAAVPGLDTEDMVSILDIVTAVLLWPTATIISGYLPWADIFMLLAHAMQLPELHQRWCEEQGLITQPCCSPALTDQALEAVLQPALALLTAWSVTILRSVDFVKANSKFSMAEREAMLPYLGDLILEGLIKHQQHHLSGVLAILGTRLTLKVGHSDIYSRGTVPRKKLKVAIEAGQRLALNLRFSVVCSASLTTCLMLGISFACPPVCRSGVSLPTCLTSRISFASSWQLQARSMLEAPDICLIALWALHAGLRSESLLRLVGPDDAAANACGLGIRRLIANVMLGVFPCLEGNADCLFLPLAAWQVHDWWLSKAFTTEASVHAFQVGCSLQTSHWYHIMPALFLCGQALQLCLWLHWLRASCNALMHCSCMQVIRSVHNRATLTTSSRVVNLSSRAQHTLCTGSCRCCHCFFCGVARARVLLYLDAGMDATVPSSKQASGPVSDDIQEPHKWSSSFKGLR